jgi:hypothetical protein
MTGTVVVGIPRAVAAAPAAPHMTSNRTIRHKNTGQARSPRIDGINLKTPHTQYPPVTMMDSE